MDVNCTKMYYNHVRRRLLASHPFTFDCVDLDISGGVRECVYIHSCMVHIPVWIHLSDVHEKSSVK